MRWSLPSLTLVCSLMMPVVACMPAQPHVVLTPSGKAVRVRKADPPDGAREIGTITAVDGERCSHLGPHGTYNRALIRLRNEAAERGANYVQIMTIEEPHYTPECYDYRFIIRGMLYRLPVAAPVEAAEDTADTANDDTEPAGDACDPPCSPGYACDSEVCRPVCNPSCSGGQVCRQDRTCGPAGDASPR